MKVREQRLKIAHLVSAGAYGGLESVVVALTRGLIGRGHDCGVIAIIDPGQAEETPFLADLRATGVTISKIQLPGRAYLREQRAIHHRVKEAGIGILHTHGYRGDIQGLVASRGTDSRVVSTVHGFAGGDPKNRLYEGLQRLCLRYADHVVAVSKPIRDRLLASGVDEKILSCVPNAWEAPAELLPRQEARTALGIHPSRPVCGWVGRLSHEKGADQFLRAIAASRTVDLVGCIVGDGPERANLEALARDLALHERVRFVGAIPRAFRTYAAFDAFCLSSRTEGTPIALLEAMYARIPIVAMTVGGVPDVISGREAWLVEPGDEAGLSRAIDEVLGADSAERCEAAFIRLRRHFGIESWIDRYEEIYRSVSGAPSALGHHQA